MCDINITVAVMEITAAAAARAGIDKYSLGRPRRRCLAIGVRCSIAHSGRVVRYQSSSCSLISTRRGRLSSGGGGGQKTVVRARVGKTTIINIIITYRIPETKTPPTPPRLYATLACGGQR